MRHSEILQTMPKGSYEDFILWICLTAKLEHIEEVIMHPLFLTIDEYKDWCASWFAVEHAIENLVAPISGAETQELLT